jgi:hypothetical protein
MQKPQNFPTLEELEKIIDGSLEPQYFSDSGLFPPLPPIPQIAPIPSYQAQPYPQITFTDEIDVTTTRLDSILKETDLPNFLNLDIQGVELQALRGLGQLINHLDYIYVEINFKEVYRGCTKLANLDEFLIQNHFERVITRRYLRHGWGEALYIRSGIVHEEWRSIFPRIQSQLQVTPLSLAQPKEALKAQPIRLTTVKYY